MQFRDRSVLRLLALEIVESREGVQSGGCSLWRSWGLEKAFILERASLAIVESRDSVQSIARAVPKKRSVWRASSGERAFNLEIVQARRREVMRECTFMKSPHDLDSHMI